MLLLITTAVDTNRLKEAINVDPSLLNDDGTVTAPVAKGQKFGTYTLTLSGEEICTVDLVAQDDVTLSALAYNFDKAKQFTSSIWFKAALIITAVLVILYIIIVAASKKKRKKYRRVKKRRKF